MSKTKQAFLTLRILSLKLLKLWALAHDLADAETASSCIRVVLDRAADGRGEAFRRAYRAALDDASVHRISAGVVGKPLETPAIPDDMLSAVPAHDLKRRINFRLDVAAIDRLKLFSEATGQSKSDLADEAIRTRIVEMASACGDPFWEHFVGMIGSMSWPEDAEFRHKQAALGKGDGAADQTNC